MQICTTQPTMIVLPCWFQVVFEGMWGPNRASGTISIDDISFYEGQCSSKYLGWEENTCESYHRQDDSTGISTVGILLATRQCTCLTFVMTALWHGTLLLFQ